MLAGLTILPQVYALYTDVIRFSLLNLGFALLYLNDTYRVIYRAEGQDVRVCSKVQNSTVHNLWNRI